MVKSIWTNIRDGEDGNDLGRRKLNLQDLLPSAPPSRLAVTWRVEADCILVSGK